MKKAALLSMIVIGAFCLMGFGPGEVTGDRHPADSYNTHSGSQGPWAKSTARESILSNKRMPAGGMGDGMDFGNMGMRGGNGLRKLGPSAVGNWDMHPADEYNRSCRYGQCATEIVKPTGAPAAGMGGETGRDKYLKKDKKEQFGFHAAQDPRTDRDDYGSRPNEGPREDTSAKKSESGKKAKSSGISLSAMDKLGRHIVTNTPHPADSYNTTMKEYREPMKMIDPSRMPYRVYKMFSGNNTLTYTRNSDSRTDSDKVTNAPEEEKSSLDGLRKKTWTLHQ